MGSKTFKSKVNGLQFDSVNPTTNSLLVSPQKVQYAELENSAKNSDQVTTRKGKKQDKVKLQMDEDEIR